MTAPIYNVYVDETFEHFMNFPRMDGYFCYVGVMLPEKAQDQLNRFWAALDARLRDEYEKATAFRIQGEFKSTFMKKLTVDVRRDAMQRVSYFLEKNGGFIAAFYTTVHGLMCWELRSTAGFQASELLPPYNLMALEAKAQELRNEKTKSPGESKLLSGLFHTIASIPLSWLSMLRAQFRICYDSRNPREDRVLLGLVQEFFPRMKEIDPERMAGYIGAEAHLDSSQIPGLMLADLMCKETRDFFHACPELLTDQSDYRLITPTSSEGFPLPIEIGGRMMKWGSMKPMSIGTREKIAHLRRDSAFGPLMRRLADEKLSCYGHFGEGRVIDVANGVFNHQVD